MNFAILLLLASATVVASGPYNGFSQQELDLVETELKTQYGIALLRQLGSGAFGSVFAASNQHGSPLAIKLSRSKTSDDQLWDALVNNELLCLRETSHPRLLKHHGNARFTFPAYNVIVLVTELLGPNLDGLLNRTEASDGLSAAVVARLALHTSEGLAYLHSRLISHRDIKPGNLVIEGELDPNQDLMTQLSSANFKIIDLSLCGWYKSQGDMENLRIGTSFYYSPEKANTESPFNPLLADAYALGLTLVQTLLGSQNLVVRLAEVEKQSGLTFSRISIRELFRKYRSSLPDDQKKQPLFQLIASLVEANSAKRLSVLEFNRRLKQHYAFTG